MNTPETLSIQKHQMDYDKNYMDINEGFPKLRHILLHLTKSMGKLAAYCEAKEHGNEPDPSEVLNEVLPDLYMHALQVANLFEADLHAKYQDRIAANIKKRSLMNKQDKPSL
jgi:hypothetical protein